MAWEPRTLGRQPGDGCSSQEAASYIFVGSNAATLLEVAQRPTWTARHVDPGEHKASLWFTNQHVKTGGTIGRALLPPDYPSW